MIKLRKDTVDESQTISFIDPNKQQLIGILGRRGEGKSYLAETIIEKYYDVGFTILDIWAAPNLENAFWCIAKQGHKKRYPITLLADESLIMPINEIDRFNDKFFTRVPLVKIVKLQRPTAKYNSEQNKQIIDVLTQEIIECRRQRRILVFNPRTFSDETNMFRTLELLLRELDNISYKHFNDLKPKDCNPLKNSRDEMTPQEKSWHKMVFLIREFGEVAPARIKGDKSGESTIIKKALLKLVRLTRHDWVCGVIDYQNASDAESSIRKQVDVWLVKGWTERLGGDEFKWIFEKIKKMRKFLIEKYHNSELGYKYADSWFPMLEGDETHKPISKKWFYAIKANDSLKLWSVPEIGFQHKEPHQKWEEITGIPLVFDETKIVTPRQKESAKVSKSAEKFLYVTMHGLKYNKKMGWREVGEKLASMQADNELTSNLDFTKTSANQLSSKYIKLRNKFGKMEELVV